MRAADRVVIVNLVAEAGFVVVATPQDGIGITLPYLPEDGDCLSCHITEAGKGDYTSLNGICSQEEDSGCDVKGASLFRTPDETH